MKDSHSFGRNQLFSLCLLLLLVPALRLFPSAVAASGHAAWLCAFAALPVLCLYAVILARTMAQRRENEGLAELCLRRMGRKNALPVLLIFSVWMLFYAAFLLRIGAERLIVTVYSGTSAAFFCISMGAVCAISSTSSLRTLTRFAKVIAPILWGMLLLVFLFGLSSVELSQLWPIRKEMFQHFGEGFLAALDVVGFCMLLRCFLMRGCTDLGGTKEFSRFAVSAVLLLTVLTVEIVGSFGSVLTQNLTLPFFSFVRNLVFFHTVERVEAFLVALWVFPDYLIITVLLLTVRRMLCALFPIPGRLCAFFCGAVSAALSLLLFPSSQVLEMYSSEIVPAVNLVLAFGFVPLLYVFALRESK